jgi:hypothetical protein
MISAWKDENDKVIAYCEFNIVNKYGIPDNNGKYCFVNNAWVHKNYRFKKYLYKMFIKESWKYPQLDFIYWQRAKYDKRISLLDIRRLYGRRNRNTTTTNAANTKPIGDISRSNTGSGSGNAADIPDAVRVCA